MKHYLISCTIILICFTMSCKNDSNKSEAKIKSLATESVTKLAKQKLELKDTEPVSQEKFHDWFPEQLAGMKLESIQEDQLRKQDISGAEAVYKSDGAKKLTVSVMDAAGKKGVNLLSMYSTVKYQKFIDTENTSIQLIEDKKRLGTETYNKILNETKINVLYKNRFSVIMNGTDMNTKETHKAFNSLKLDKLFSAD